MFILIGLILAAAAIMYLVMKSEIKNLRKANREHLQELMVMNSRRDISLKQLKSYLTQDPISAFQLLTSHVADAEKTRK